MANCVHWEENDDYYVAVVSEKQKEDVEARMEKVKAYWNIILTVRFGQSMYQMRETSVSSENTGNRYRFMLHRIFMKAERCSLFMDRRRGRRKWPIG